ncbi:hypothetical protein Tco_0492515 [Tanacetum coccineum]
MLFSFTSMGAKVDESINKGKGPYIYIIQGQNFHRMGSLVPVNNTILKFCQLYIYDTENEVSNIINANSGKTREISNKKKDQLNHVLICELKALLDEVNLLVKPFRRARDCFRNNVNERFKIKLYGKRAKDGRNYNLPEANEVAALIVGDIRVGSDKRDIVIQSHEGELQRISELHVLYMGLQYPLIYARGEDGYRTDIDHAEESCSRTKKRKQVTIREWLAYRIQERNNGYSLLQNSRKLYQQFLVDGYTMVESQRLSFLRREQKNLRCASYSKLSSAVNNGETSSSRLGKKVYLPSSYTGGARYMIQNYLDAMAICKWFGYPDLFITFTCNTKWPEINRFMAERNLKSEDRPEVVSRVFKMKLDTLIKDLKKNKLFGRVEADPEHIDQVISAEILDEFGDPELYELVKTTIDEDGYPVYMRRDNGRTVTKSVTDLVNIATDVVVDEEVGEIKEYYDCQYVSSCKVAWIIFQFDIHERTPLFERLPFHLKGEQSVYFDEGSCIEDIVNNPSVNETMFTEWMEANKLYDEAKELTYVEFPTKFVWKKDIKKWRPRKKGFSLGRVHHVSPSAGDAYFFRILLNKKKGPTSWEEIRTVDGELFNTNKDACYAMDTVSRPEHVWECTWTMLAEDMESIQRKTYDRPGLELSDEQKMNLTLCAIEKLLQRNGTSLKQIPNMPYPDLSVESQSINRLVEDELSYSVPKLNADHSKMLTSKTFVWKTLSAAIRRRRDIVLNVASSGIAALLLPGGRTAHSRFAIPINVNEDSTSLDRTLKDIMRSSNPFGGIVVVFGGYFRQILPVIPRGTRSEIVNASLRCSYIWDDIQVLKLTENMRLRVENNNGESEETKAFADWILSIGNGEVGEDQEGKAEVEIPNGILIKDTIAILAPTNDVVNKINERMMKLIPTEERKGTTTESTMEKLNEKTSDLDVKTSADCDTKTEIPDPLDVDLKLSEFDIQLMQKEIDEELKAERLKNLMAWNWDAVIDLSKDVIIVIDDESDYEVVDYKKSVVINDTQDDTIDDNKQPAKRARKSDSVGSSPSEKDNNMPASEKTEEK